VLIPSSILPSVLNLLNPFDGDAGGNSIFGSHENMVGKRISQELLNLQHRQTLAMLGDEAMTSQKCIYCLHQLKKATRSIYL
jgi:hypothetical protein